MDISVLKFGGTSVGDSKAIRECYSRIYENNSEVKILVFSAFAKVTDLLISAIQLAENDLKHSFEIIEQIENIHLKIIEELELANSYTLKDIIINLLSEIKNIIRGINLIKELTPKLSDKVVGYGEILSTTVLSYYFNSRDLKNLLCDSRNYIITNSDFTKAKINTLKTQSKFIDFLKPEHNIYVFQGFIASDESNATTLGRGGSDYTAAIIGNCLKNNNYNVNDIEIWTDVNGIMTADPKIIPDAQTIPFISFDEVIELSYFGAKVIHPDTVKPAIDNNIPVIVRNTFDKNNMGTTILKNCSNEYICQVKLDDVNLLTIIDYNISSLSSTIIHINNILNKTASKVYFQSQSAYTYRILFRNDKININDYINTKYELIKSKSTAYVSSNQIELNRIIANNPNKIILSGYSAFSIIILE